MTDDDRKRLRELADRLVDSGPKCCAVSASECHEISEGVDELLDDLAALTTERDALRGEAERLRAGWDASIADRTELKRAYDYAIEENLDFNVKVAGEINELRQQLAAVTAARDEACDAWERYVEQVHRLDKHATWPAKTIERISELRKVGQ